MRTLRMPGYSSVNQLGLILHYFKQKEVYVLTKMCRVRTLLFAQNRFTEYA